MWTNVGRGLLFALLLCLLRSWLHINRVYTPGVSVLADFLGGVEVLWTTDTAVVINLPRLQ